MECPYSTSDLLVYRLMYLTTILGNFLRPAPLKNHNCHSWNSWKTGLKRAMFPAWQIPWSVTSLGGCRDSYQQTDRQHVGYWGLFSSKTLSEINFRTSTSSSNKLGTHAFCQRELALLISKPFSSAEVISASAKIPRWEPGTQGPGRIQESLLCFEDFLMKYDDGCLPQLPHPLWRLKINKQK